MTQAYPLVWPKGLPRTERRASSQFKTALPTALKNVEVSLRLFGVDSGKPVTGMVLSSNVSLGHANPAGQEHHDFHRYVTAPVQPSKIYGHPTVKPEVVMDKIMRNVACETVCDPFMGTGSTGVAAIKAGKLFIGIEHNEQHFETACRRIAETLATHSPP